MEKLLYLCLLVSLVNWQSMHVSRFLSHILLLLGHSSQFTPMFGDRHRVLHSLAVLTMSYL